MNTSEQKSQENNLNALIRQAEIMEKKIKLDIQLKKNLSFFKSKNLAMYEKFNHFQPKNQKLSIDQDGKINLINIPSGKPAYPESPDSFARKQVEAYIKKPSRINIGFKHSQLSNPDMIHPQLTNKLLDDFTTLELDNYHHPKTPLGLVVMMGCGLGLQIKELIENHDVRNLFLYDTNEDSFYASLFTIDWEEIVNTFEDRKGKIRINVGEDIETTLYRMRALPYEIGVYNMTTMHFFMHTESQDNRLFYETMIKESSFITSYMGFFDDEQISFSHTIHCINENTPIFMPSKKATHNLPPVFIVGNGPSLDNLVDFIKSHQEKAIIISCGTSLASLESIGVQPNFHIEMERNYSLTQILRESTSLAFMKGITLLSLNTIPPAARELFKDHYIALKPNDLGAVLYKEFIKSDHFFELPLCNPTVVNCGISYALSMGFSEIYLLGTDLGMKDKNEHHSKHSFWSKLDLAKKPEKKGLYDHSFSDNQYQVLGNFSDTVTTSFILDSSKKNIEVLLKNHPKAQCYNLNDGALIKGAIPKKPEDASINIDNIDKEKIMDNLVKNNFKQIKTPKIDKNIAEEKYLWVLKKAKQSLLLPDNCEDIKTLHNEIGRIFQNVLAIEKMHNVTALLIKGSIQVHGGILVFYCKKAKDEEEFKTCYQLGKNTYNDLIEGLMKIMETDPLKIDNTVAFGTTQK